jgi:hypothetical protein
MVIPRLSPRSLIGLLISPLAAKDWKPLLRLLFPQEARGVEIDAPEGAVVLDPRSGSRSWAGIATEPEPEP